MNAPSKIPAQKRPAKPNPKMPGKEREFLPAAIEMMETPPSPSARLFTAIICVLLTGTLLWSWFGHIEIHAVAQGRIVPNGKVKVIQPLEPAAVGAIHVEAGDQVAAGDLLIELDPTEDAATRAQIDRELGAAKVEASRLRAELDAAGSGKPSGIIGTLAWPLDDDLYRREALVLEASVSRLEAEHSSINAEIAQRHAEKDRVIASVSERELLVGVLIERMKQQERLAKRGVSARTQTLELAGALHEAKAELESERGAIAEADAAIAALEMRRAEAMSRFVSERAERLSEIERRIDQLKQDLVKAISREQRMRLTSPVGGTVQQLAVTTVGQVVTTGQQLMIVVPHGVGLDVEAMILNKDMGFVEAGQDAVLKVEAFPYTKYGALPGTIRKISNDAVAAGQAPDAPIANPVDQEQVNPRGQNGGGLVFPALVTLGQDWIHADGRKIGLTPGMAVTVEVKTGERRVIEYLLTPLLRYKEEAMRER